LDFGYSYPPALALRFSLSYLIVGVIALGLETGRARLESRLREEKERDEEPSAPPRGEGGAEGGASRP